MSEEKPERNLDDFKGQLLELAALANNTVMEGSFSGDAILKAANLMDICHKIYKELTPPQEDPKAERDTVSNAEIVTKKANEQ